MYSIEEIEKKQNIRFPDKYKEAYSSNFIELERCSNIYIDNEKIVIKKFMNADEIMSAIDEFYDYFGYDIIPIGITEYDDYICFYYKTQAPCIIYWNYELTAESPNEGIVYLYKDFDTFVDAIC